ncbi:MAG: hypothetical protein V9F03_06990 [Microthrixaceae bacterium]
MATNVSTVATGNVALTESPTKVTGSPVSHAKRCRGYEKSISEIFRQVDRVDIESVDHIDDRAVDYNPLH